MSKCFRLTGFMAGLLMALFLTHSAYAVDAWRIDEIFTSSDGTVQYVKLTTTSNNQQTLSGRVLRSLNTAGGTASSYTFPSSLSTVQTANRSVLLGTTAFTSLTQLSVDFPLPAGFLLTEGGSVQLVDIHSMTYQRTQMPKNGAQALRADGVPVTATPRNFAGQTATVNAPVISPFTASSLTLNLPVVDILGTDTVNATLQLTKENPLEFTVVDAYVYGSGLTAGTRASRVLNTGVLYIPAILLGTDLIELNMTLLRDNPIVFGNLSVVSVTPVTPVTPTPNPTPTPLELSIARGSSSYGQQCASCHGGSGEGTFAAPALQGYTQATFAALLVKINTTMPLGNAAACRDSANSTCGTDVSNYIINSLSGTPNEVVYPY